MAVRLLDQAANPYVSLTGGLSPLGECVDFTRAFAPSDPPVHSEPLSASSLRLVPSENIDAYRTSPNNEWIEYGVLREMMAKRTSGTNTTALPQTVIAAPAKLILRDTPKNLRASVTWQPV